MNQEVWLRIPLQLGTVIQAVDVNAPFIPIDRDTPALHTFIDERAITELPLDGRNFLELALLAPGTVPPPQGSASSARGDFALSINGAREDFNGFLLDGYPRTLPQAEFLTGLLAERKLPKPLAIHIDVPAGAIVSRITSRRTCPVCKKIYNVISQPPKVEGICDADGAKLVTRADDTEETVMKRLSAYEQATGPVIEYYAARGAWRIDGNRAPSEIQREIEGILKPSAKAAVK
jgi:adenylate kinase family enzyme